MRNGRGPSGRGQTTEGGERRFQFGESGQIKALPLLHMTSWLERQSGPNAEKAGCLPNPADTFAYVNVFLNTRKLHTGICYLCSHIQILLLSLRKGLQNPN